MGLAPVLVERIYETIAEINRQGTTILLVEQNANFALDVSNRGYVLETGTWHCRTSPPSCARTPRSRRRTWAHDRIRAARGEGPLADLHLAALGDASTWLSDRKGYGEKPGLITGLILSAIGVVIWLFWPARADSRWKVQGAIPRRGDRRSPRRARSTTPSRPSSAVLALVAALRLGSRHPTEGRVSVHARVFRFTDVTPERIEALNAGSTRRVGRRPVYPPPASRCWWTPTRGLRSSSSSSTAPRT